MPKSELILLFAVLGLGAYYYVNMGEKKIIELKNKGVE